MARTLLLLYSAAFVLAITHTAAEADHLPEGAKIDARSLHDDVDCARGQVENRIKGSSWIC